MQTAHQLKTTEPLPSRLQTLPVDERGYVVPWFVAWVNGKPEFRAMDAEKRVRAVKEKRCWVCGQQLGTMLCFVIGPMCGINRIAPEPPSHYECAAWSARNCPFLSNPHMVRREDEAMNNAQLAAETPGHAIARNPGVMLLWITRGYEIVPDASGNWLLMVGEPQRVEWWREGRRATRAEVEASVATGLPILRKMADSERGDYLRTKAHQEIDSRIGFLESLYPQYEAKTEGR
jgi:hypothetical protein